eukprot:gene17269-23812_t
MHGAGLANCVFGSTNMIIVEMQMQNAFGFDSFMKISHMSHGHHLFYDIRGSKKIRGVTGSGTLLSQEVIEDIVDITLTLFNNNNNNNNNKEKSRKLSNNNNNLNKFKSNENINKMNVYHNEIIIDTAHKNIILDQKLLGDNNNNLPDFLLKLFGNKHYFIRYYDNNAYVSSISNIQNNNNIKKNKNGKKRRLLEYQYDVLNKTNNDSFKIVKSNNNSINSNNRLLVTSNIVNKDGVFVNMSSGEYDANYRKYWLFLDPSKDDLITLESIYGPLLSNNFQHCLTLPYYKFRTMTMLPREHRNECDRNFNFWKPSGQIQSKLLKEFIGVGFNDYFMDVFYSIISAKVFVIQVEVQTVSKKKHLIPACLFKIFWCCGKLQMCFFPESRSSFERMENVSKSARMLVRFPHVLQLYSAPTANGLKVHAALEEICQLRSDFNYEPHTVNIREGECRAPDFRLISPAGKIPVIVDPQSLKADGEPYHIFESGAILIYLAEKYDVLIPHDKFERMETIKWLMWSSTGLSVQIKSF